uniref:Uncharacterized protein n=1 Tax=Rhizophora mucronata TaxID=61149 RepID=A0A2P2MZM5_RHIMU
MLLPQSTIRKTQPITLKLASIYPLRTSQIKGKFRKLTI